MTEMPRITAGWYTPDYAEYADKLKTNLHMLGELHDFVEVPKAAGGWERNTLRKPEMMLSAMRRHSSRTIIFLDVDCEVLEPLGALADVGADISVHVRCKFLRDGTPRFNIRSGTMVLRPSIRTETFLHHWANLNSTTSVGCVDQRTLPMAIAATPGLKLEIMQPRFCCVPSDGVASPAILHDSASRKHRKVPSWLRSTWHILGRTNRR